MPLLQHKLSLKVSQRQVLTPGLVQMVTVLALNRLELKEMINQEMTENPVLEELETGVPLLDEVSAREEARERAENKPEEGAPESESKDPFDEIDFGSYFKDYLDPGYRSSREMESVEKPSFENFLSRPDTLTDHLMWQLGAMRVSDELREAAELIIGNLDDDGYLTATIAELAGTSAPVPPADGPAPADQIDAPVSLPAGTQPPELPTNGATNLFHVSPGEPEAADPPEVQPEVPPAFQRSAEPFSHPAVMHSAEDRSAQFDNEKFDNDKREPVPQSHADFRESAAEQAPGGGAAPSGIGNRGQFSEEILKEAVELVQQMDPPGVAARDLRECLLGQLRYHQQLVKQKKNGSSTNESLLLEDCGAIVDSHLQRLQNKQYREIAKAMNRPPEAIDQAVDFIRRLDPKPGRRYNKQEARIIEPDVAFVKQGDEYLVIMNEEELPQLRLSPTYRRLMERGAAEKEVRSYVKERYKSAIQLIKNIEQRKHTIARVCHAIIERQKDFLDHGVDRMKPMMIKEVAEEIGVHPSTVSRAVSNKYVHTPQGVFELRYFFSEHVNGPEGGGTSLLILKRRVKKIIEEEDPSRPLTDEHITRILQSQGIKVTRRTVAKYREDMHIPSTHQRRVKS